MTLKTPWTLIDAHGEGILACIVTDSEMGHVAVFDSASTARAVVETMNRAESREQELAEVTAELEKTRDKFNTFILDMRELQLRRRGETP